jgi:hypothetical protein
MIYRSGNYCARLKALTEVLLLSNSDFETSTNIFNSVWHIPEFWFYQATSNNLKMGKQSVLHTSETLTWWRGCLTEDISLDTRHYGCSKWEINGPHFMMQHYVLRQCSAASRAKNAKTRTRLDLMFCILFLCPSNYYRVVSTPITTPDMVPFKLSGIILLCALLVHGSHLICCRLLSDVSHFVIAEFHHALCW